jgi:hypothetical protein
MSRIVGLTIAHGVARVRAMKGVMVMRHFTGMTVLLIISYLLPTTAQAQARSGTEVGVSYSFVRVVEGDGLNVPVGWLVSLARSTNDWLALVGEGAGSYKTTNEGGDTLWIHTFQGGVRVSARTNATITPFGQFLLGSMHLRSDEGGGNVLSETHFSIEPGGGLDLTINQRTSIRIAAGFPMSFVDDNIVNLFRFQVGVVFGIGNR